MIVCVCVALAKFVCGHNLFVYSELPVDCLKSPMPVHVTESHVAPVVKTKVRFPHFLPHLNFSVFVHCSVFFAIVLVAIHLFVFIIKLLHAVQYMVIITIVMMMMMIIIIIANNISIISI